MPEAWELKLFSFGICAPVCAVVKRWCHFNVPKKTPQWRHQKHQRVILYSQVIFNTGQILGLLVVEASDGFNRKECVVCTSMRHLT